MLNEADEMKISSEKLAKQIEKWTGISNHFDTPIDGLRLSRWSQPTPPTSYTQEPSICLIAQGKKRVLLGEESYTYDATHFLISTVGLPVIANIIEASSDQPYLGLIMKLDLQEISQLLAESEVPIHHDKQLQKGIAVGTLTQPLLDAFIRLLGLLDESENIKILAPVIKREILFRLLMTEQGSRLSQIVTEVNHSHQISKAINWLKDNFVKPLNVSDLATSSGMSKSAFYNHFRTITSMTPLQFQKKLRLNEARRLMLTENLDAMVTTFKVGYESPSQFSREYSRLFGAPPAKDIKNLRQNSSG